MVGVNFSRVKLLVREKYWSPLKNWSLFTGFFFTNEVKSISRRYVSFWRNELLFIILKIIHIQDPSRKSVISSSPESSPVKDKNSDYLENRLEILQKRGQY